MKVSQGDACSCPLTSFAGSPQASSGGFTRLTAIPANAAATSAIASASPHDPVIVPVAISALSVCAALLGFGQAKGVTS